MIVIVSVIIEVKSYCELLLTENFEVDGKKSKSSKVQVTASFEYQYCDSIALYFVVKGEKITTSIFAKNIFSYVGFFRYIRRDSVKTKASLSRRI